MVLDGKRAGLVLPDKEREKLTGFKKQLSSVCVEFQAHPFLLDVDPQSAHSYQLLL